MPLDDSALISSSGANADVYAYGDGRALKLFRTRDPRHAYELIAARAAAAQGLPTPRVWGEELVEVDEREGIVFDRVDGVTMHQHVSEHLDQAEAAGRAMAEIQAQIHACEPPDLTDLRAVLAISIAMADALDTPRKDAATDLLFSLPSGRALCHNDIHPLNLLLADEGWAIIDWEAACRGNRLAGHARTWLVLSSFWPDSRTGPESAVAKTWRRFRSAYIQTYRELLPTPMEELRQWQTVVAAVGLAWDRTAPPAPRVEVMDALLASRPHGWLSDQPPE